MKKGVFYSVGVGPGDPELITLKAVRTLERCPVVAAPQTKNGEMLALAIARQAVSLEGKTAMLNLGDVSIYATAAYLADILAADGYETRMVPGVTSFCAVAARLNTSLTGIDTPLHIVPGGCGALEECLAQPGAKVLMKSGRQLPGVLAALERRGLLERSALVSNCGLPGEQVYADLSAFPREQDAGYFATIIVKED